MLHAAKEARAALEDLGIGIPDAAFDAVAERLQAGGAMAMPSAAEIEAQAVRMRQKYAGQGCNITDEQFAGLLAQMSRMAEAYAGAAGQVAQRLHGRADATPQVEELARTLLLEVALPPEDDVPQLSSKAYAFDAEVFDVARMYTLFLEGVGRIIPDAAFSEISEDLSQMTEKLAAPESPLETPTDGLRSVRFRCNGHAHTITLDSCGDWFNPKMIDVLNGILAAEGCQGQLHCVGEDYDQMVILVYGSGAYAQAVDAALGGSAGSCAD